MRKPFLIGGSKVKAGERQLIDLKLPQRHSHSNLNLPIHVIHGRYDGPSLFVSAVMHGDEIGGIEVIRRLLSLKSLKRLRGTLITIPILNSYGFTTNSRYLPDRRDLNRLFPGSPQGSLGGRLAHLFMKEVVGQCTHGIDLHTAANHRVNLPQIRADLDNPLTRWLAQTFDVPVLINSKLRDGSLRAAVAEKNIPILLYEGGEALRFDEVSIRAALRGIMNVMKALKMVTSRQPLSTSIRGSIAKSTRWVRAPMEGILHAHKSFGNKVLKGETLGTIYDPYDYQEISIEAPLTGLIIGRTNLPVIHEGDALFHIANFNQIGEVTTALEHFGELLDPETEQGVSGMIPIV